MVKQVEKIKVCLFPSAITHLWLFLYQRDKKVLVSTSEGWKKQYLECKHLVGLLKTQLLTKGPPQIYYPSRIKAEADEVASKTVTAEPPETGLSFLVLQERSYLLGKTTKRKPMIFPDPENSGLMLKTGQYLKNRLEERLDDHDILLLEE